MMDKENEEEKLTYEAIQSGRSKEEEEAIHNTTTTTTTGLHCIIIDNGYFDEINCPFQAQIMSN